MTKFKRQFTKTYKGHPGIENDMPSMTVPDMNLSLKELLHNHTRGIQSDVKHYEGEYFEDDIPVITDLNDLTELKRKNNEKQKELQQKADEEFKAAKLKRAHAQKSTEKVEKIEVPKTIDTPKNTVLPDKENEPKKH